MSRCTFCKEWEAVWTSPTGHQACQQCRISELHRMFSNCYWMLMDVREQLDRFGEDLLDEGQP